MNREDIEETLKDMSFNVIRGRRYISITDMAIYQCAVNSHIKELEQSIQTLIDENKILEQQYKDDERTIKKLVAENKGLRCCGNCGNDDIFKDEAHEYGICEHCEETENWQPKGK